jgi:hypothetical protein
MDKTQSMSASRTGNISRRVRIALLAWLAMLGPDFLLNGALFAGMYQQGGTFFLAPGEAFRRIPIGYAAFLILAIALVEIADRLRVATFKDGIGIGLGIGGVLAAVWSLSLVSIATLDPLVALEFAVIWLALLLVGSAVAASGLGRPSLRRVALGVAGFDVLCVATVIALQSFGVVQTVEL